MEGWGGVHLNDHDTTAESNTSINNVVQQRVPDENDVLIIARSLTTEEQDALLGKFSFNSPVAQEQGEARLRELGLWHYPLVKGRHRSIRTDFGERVRRLLMDHAL